CARRVLAEDIGRGRVAESGAAVETFRSRRSWLPAPLRPRERDPKPDEAFRVSELRPSALFREHHMQQLRAAPRLSAGAREGDRAKARQGRLARARGAEGPLPFLRQRRIRVLQLAGLGGAKGDLWRRLPP